MAAPFVSTGDLPAPERVAALVREAHERYRDDAGGELSQVYPALAQARADRFGICVVSTDGRAIASGDADDAFTIMSVAKPFVFALVCDLLGPEDGTATDSA